MEEFSALDELFARRIAHFAGVKISVALKKLMKSTREGHLCLPLFALDEIERKELRESEQKLSSFVRLTDDNLYMEKNYLIEQTIQEEIRRLSKKTSDAIVSLSLPVNDEQREAVAVCLQNGLVFLSGGPGTGKTFTASAIVSAFCKNKDKKVALAAPTARAADHLAVSIEKNCSLKCPSSTLHKLLNVGSIPAWPQAGFTLDLDLLIVDEASMIDAPLFATLLKALPNHCKTILMGDPHQLSPVGIGNVFHDLIASCDTNICKAHLKHSMRTENQQILGLSHQVLRGKLPDFPLATLDEFFSFTATKSQPDPKQLLQDLQKRRILSCLRVGPQGSDAMNEATFKQILHATPFGKWWWAPLMIVSNDDQTGLCNGELGVYIEKKGMKESGYAYFPKNQNRVPFYALPKFEWAFCSSVHKAQGSEFEEVIILAPKGSERFGREMLYTAITRAKNSVKIVAEKQTLETMVSKSQAKHSGLV